MTERRSPVAFLLGAPRSGTTMLSLLLNQHPAVYCPQEPWLLLGLEALGQTPPEHPADAPLLAGLVAEFLGQERNAILHAAAETIYREVVARQGKTLLVDKTPRYYLCPQLLESFLPESRGILLLRNPLDIAASYLSSWKVDLPQLIRERRDSPFLLDYVLGLRRLLELRQRQPLLSLHYETLVRHPERELAAIFAHLGLACETVSTRVDPRVSGYAASYFADKKIFDSPTVHAHSVDSYKQAFSAEAIALLLGALGEELFTALGYGAVWQEAQQHFALTAVPDASAELSALAEGYLAQRLADCRTAANDFSRQQPLDRLRWEQAQAQAQLGQLQAQEQAQSQQLAELETRCGGLEAQRGQLEAQNAALAQQVHDFVHMGLRARLRGLLGHAKRTARQLLRQGLWRLARTQTPQNLPRITVVTPVYNGAAHLAETMESVLRQDYPDLEYIIVDGGSTDETLEIIRSYQARSDLPQRISRLISDPDEGMYDAIAKGFEEASGEIFCYLNADDLFECGGLLAVGRYFAAHPRAEAIYHEDVVLSQGWKFPNVRQPERVDTVDLLAGHILFQDGVFWRRACYERCGGVRRDLRLAGDFDLWLRMSAQTRFIRRPGHVSCFRIREGQLSAQMQRYHEEMQRAIQDFMRGQPRHRRLNWRLRGLVRPLVRRLQRRLTEGWLLNPAPKQRLYFAADFGNTPAVSLPPLLDCVPRSPVDGQAAERLLFSTPDTRFGEQEISHVYLDSRHGIAITHPPIAPERLDGLYRTHYSNPPTEIKPPRGPSPYQRYNGRRLWEKLLRRLPVERFLANPWGDNTLAELTQVLQAAGVDTTRPLRFLDTGCFEGHLLDQIRSQRPWLAVGLEPNHHAVERARAKGHEVWQGHAEQAVEILPEERLFDVVYMGQSIEHVDDPLRVLRRLRQLLAPGGALVMSTPNLDSREIVHFGPTWAHWHTPYHRYIFSRRGLTALARQAGLAPIYCRSYSHPYWTTMSIAQNQLGLAGSASHAVAFDPLMARRAQRDQVWKEWLWNRLGQGDYCFFVAKEAGHD